MPQHTIPADIQELAGLLEPTWPSRLADLYDSGVLLNESTGAPAAAGGGGGEPGSAGPGFAGAPDGGNGLYDLSEYPEEMRGFMEAELNKVNGRFDQRQSEFNQLRDQLGPLAAIDGIADIPPEHMAELVQLYGILQDPEQAQAWLAEAAQQAGAGAPSDPDGWYQMGVDQGWIDAEGNMTDPEGGGQDLEAKFAAMLDERLGPLQQTLTQQQEAQQVEQSKAQLQERMEALKTEHGDFDEQSVIELAFAFQDDDDPLGKAYERYTAITGGAQGDALQGKLDQTNGQALNGGRADTAPPTHSFQDGSAREAALARMTS